MANRAKEKIIESLIQLLEGFSELQDSIELEVAEEALEDPDEDKVESEGDLLDPDVAVVKAIRTAIEATMEAEDYTPEEVANVIAALTEALEEIDPEIFEEEDDEEEVDEEDDDDIDYDEDDDYEDDEDDD